jgi:hypothetical protein
MLFETLNHVKAPADGGACSQLKLRLGKMLSQSLGGKAFDLIPKTIAP